MACFYCILINVFKNCDVFKRTYIYHRQRRATKVLFSKKKKNKRTTASTLDNHKVGAEVYTVRADWPFATMTPRFCCRSPTSVFEMSELHRAIYKRKEQSNSMRLSIWRAREARASRLNHTFVSLASRSTNATATIRTPGKNATHDCFGEATFCTLAALCTENTSPRDVVAFVSVALNHRAPNASNATV